MRYLVTGGCGFIGSHVVDRLVKDGHRVVVIDDLSSGRRDNLNPAAILVEGSVLDAKLCRETLATSDACIHLAAIASVTLSASDWVGSHRVNVTGLVTLLHQIRELRVRIPVAYASSAAIYGNQVQMPISEDVVARPISAYGADKLGCEFQARIAGISFGLPTTGFRFFNVYGPRQDPSSPYSGVISIFAKTALARSPLSIYGDGKQSRDFIYVDDIVEILLSGLRHASPEAKVYNACTGVGTTVEELARMVMAEAGSDAPILYKPSRSGDIRESIGSTERASSELRYQTAVSLASGLARTMAWMSKDAGPERVNRTPAARAACTLDE